MTAQADMIHSPFAGMAPYTKARPLWKGLHTQFGLAEAIPDAPLPLISPEEQVPLPLQAAFATVYQARGFRLRLDYQVDPDPPLTEAERAFVQTQLTIAGIRLH